MQRLSALLLCFLSWVTVGVAQESTPAKRGTLDILAKGLDHPVALVSHAGEPTKLFVVEREGVIRVIENGRMARHDLLDIESILSPEENDGLSGLAFPSDFAKSKTFYVSYTDKQGDTIIGRFRAESEKSADEDDLMVTLKVVQASPHSHSSSIAFGPDNYLYIALGDVPSNKNIAPLAQNSDSLFGKVLRIDISDPQRYKIPTDNPLAHNNRGAPEVWALGFKQPRHLSFDLATRRLFLIDTVAEFQHIDQVECGKNYTTGAAERSKCLGPLCDSEPFAPSLYSYPGKAVGGFIYSGELHADLKGAYLFADIPSKSIYKLTNGGGVWKSAVVATTQVPVVALGQGSGGEIYAATQDGTLGMLQRLN